MFITFITGGIGDREEAPQYSTLSTPDSVQTAARPGYNRNSVSLLGLTLNFGNTQTVLDRSDVLQNRRGNKHFEPVLVCCGFFLTVR